MWNETLLHAFNVIYASRTCLFFIKNTLVSLVGLLDILIVSILSSSPSFSSHSITAYVEKLTVLSLRKNSVLCMEHDTGKSPCFVSVHNIKMAGVDTVSRQWLWVYL